MKNTIETSLAGGMFHYSAPFCPLCFTLGFYLSGLGCEMGFERKMGPFSTPLCTLPLSPPPTPPPRYLSLSPAPNSQSPIPLYNAKEREGDFPTPPQERCLDSGWGLHPSEGWWAAEGRKKAKIDRGKWCPIRPPPERWVSDRRNREGGMGRSLSSDKKKSTYGPQRGMPPYLSSRKCRRRNTLAGGGEGNTWLRRSQVGALFIRFSSLPPLLRRENVRKCLLFGFDLPPSVVFVRQACRFEG